MKKWTYLAVTGMLLGTAPVFTGCIDNDEPEGITILRQAKSELLRARASVEEANAASILADAALKEAQKAVVAAQARYYEALAAEQEAKALKAQYEAELRNIKNEEERARLEALISQLEAQQQERERQAQLAAAQLELDLMEVKTELAKQQALYEQALKDLALAKNTLTEAQKAHLDEWITAVENAKEAVDKATETYEEKAEALTTAIKELDAAQSDELAKRQLARNVELKQREYDAAVEAYNVAKAAAEADFSSIEALEAQKKELDNQLEGIEKQLADLEIERTKLETSTVTEAQKVEELKEAYEAIAGVWDENGNLVTSATKEYTLPEIKIQNRNIMGLPTYINDWGISKAEFKYSEYLLALSDGTADNFKQKETLNEYLKDVNSWTRTANGDAWTNNEILEMTPYLTNLNEQIKEKKAIWKQAVEAYQGKLETDATQMPGYDKVKEAVDKYNAALKAYQEAVEAYDTYAEENLQSWQILNQTIEQANQEYIAAVGGYIEGEYVVGSIQEKYDATVNAAQSNVDSKRFAYETAYALARQAEADYALIANPTEEQTKARDEAVEAAQDAYEVFEEEEGKFDQIEQEAETLMWKEMDKAYADYQVALANARETALENASGDAAIQEKLKELENAISNDETGEGAWFDYYNAYQEARKIYYGYYKTLELDHFNEEILVNAYRNEEEVDAVELAEVYRYELKKFISQLSDELFGTETRDVEARLVDLTVDEIKDEISADYMELVPDADFVPFTHINDNLYRYGMVGTAANLQAKIDIAKATLENEEAIAALKAELNDHLAAVNDIIAKAAEEAASAEWAYTQADEALQAKFADIDKKIEEAEALKYAVKPVIDKVDAAIETYLSYESKDAETLDDLKKDLNDALVWAEGEMYDAETALLKAQERQKKYANEEANAVTIAQEDLAEAEKDLQEAQDELTAANEALLAEIDRISEQNEEVAE